MKKRMKAAGVWLLVGMAIVLAGFRREKEGKRARNSLGFPFS